MFKLFNCTCENFRVSKRKSFSEPLQVDKNLSSSVNHNLTFEEWTSKHAPAREILAYLSKWVIWRQNPNNSKHEKMKSIIIKYTNT